MVLALKQRGTKAEIDKQKNVSCRERTCQYSKVGGLCEEKK